MIASSTAGRRSGIPRWPASRISRFSGVAMAFLALVGVTTRPVAAAVPVKRSQPVIEVRTADKDSGVVEEGTIIKQRFIVANRGQADLELKAVKPSCGCSAARWDQWIRPGQEGAIETEFNTAYFRGPVTKHFMVF